MKANELAKYSFRWMKKMQDSTGNECVFVKTHPCSLVIVKLPISEKKELLYVD